jgi:hypothetical protein
MEVDTNVLLIVDTPQVIFSSAAQASPNPLTIIILFVNLIK